MKNPYISMPPEEQAMVLVSVNEIILENISQSKEFMSDPRLHVEMKKCKTHITNMLDILEEKCIREDKNTD